MMKRYLAACGLVLLSAAALSARPDPQTVVIGRLAVPPQLDGRLDDWSADTTTILLGEAANTLPRPGKWGGATDLSGTVRLAWDDTYFYLAADVVDDKPLQAAATGAEPWHGDTLEIFFNAFPGEQRQSGFRQIGLVPPFGTGAEFAAICPQGDIIGAEGAALARPNGYTFECRIPWSNFPEVSPKEAAKVGFQVMLNDRDSNGRKSQLCWYASAITYAHPLDMNVLSLAANGAGITGPRVLAGPTAAAISNPSKAGLSVVAEIPGAAVARVSLVGSEPLNIPLEKSGERLTAGSGNFPISDREDGPVDFSVAVLSTSGEVLATTTFHTDLAGRRYTDLRDRLKALKERLKSADLLSANPEALAGLGYWAWRLDALAANEARPESLEAPMLDQMMVELGDIEGALAQLQRGEDPYAGRTGSFMRAYRSPLTGEFRPHSLYVPADVKPDGEKRPLIVMLHGIFGDDRHLFQRLDSVRDLGAIVYQAASYRQFDWSDISAAETWAGLDQVLATQPVDPDRIYLIGHHIGGRGVLQLAMDRPEQFAALGSLFPGVDTRPAYDALRLYPKFYDEAAKGNLIPFPVYKLSPPPEPLTDPVERAIMERLSLVTRAPNISGLPMRMVRGEAQPDAGAERLALLEALAKIGDDVPVRHEIGAQHGSSPPELSDPGFYRWLLAQRRGSAPRFYEFVATGLRDNTAWVTRIDRLTSPLEPGRVRVAFSGGVPMMKTAGVEAISPVFAHGTFKTWEVDGQMFDAVPLVRGPDGLWMKGQPKSDEKRHGLSGPIDDFQFERFIYVYGTSGTPEEAAALEKATRKLANRGLGTEFSVKADRDITDEDKAKAHLVLVGTPQTNALLATIADRLPLKWNEGALSIGDTSVTGPGSGACVIYPNPESAGRYVVVMTAMDDSGYGGAWNQRAGVDYVLVQKSAGEAGKVEPVSRGVFTLQWMWSPELEVKTKITNP